MEICGDVDKVSRIDNFKFNFSNEVLISAGGIDAKNSWRNKHYTFTVNQDNSIVDFVVNSRDINCRLYILNSVGDYINYSSLGRTLEEIIAFEFVKKGIYTVVVCGEEDKAGGFDLSFYSKVGILSDIRILNSTNFNPHCGIWKPGGGIDNELSPLNDKFSFTIKDRTFIDVISNAAGTNSRIFILNSANKYITYSSIGVNPKVVEYNLLPGSYSLVLTAPENTSGTYCVTIHSKEGSITDLIPK